MRKIDQKHPSDPHELPALIDDVSVPLFITEGTFKADSAVSLGLCCISIPGVSAWTRNPAWNDIPHKGRRVFLAFDSDTAEKPAVNRELRKLKQWLESHGADVRAINLPIGLNGSKTGLDDFIGAQVAAGEADEQIRAALLSFVSDDLPALPAAIKTNDGRPQIIVEPGQRPAMIDRCELELSDHAKHRIFQRGPLLVHIVKHSEGEEAEAIIRPVGALKQKILDSVSLEEKLARAINFRRYKSDGELAPCDVPARLASAILSRSGDWRLPMLVGVIEAPTVLSDGSLIEQEGFDPRSHLYLCSSNIRAWLPVSELPSQSDAIAAMRILLGPFFEFPFERESDRSTYVTEVLTGLVRRQLTTAPLFAHSAPQQASGKSLLADATGLIVTGRVTPSMPFGSSDEEVRKRLTSVLIGGDQIVNIDNVTRPIQSDALAMILSQETYADRILGTNERPTLATNSLFLATGNNLVVQGDLASRTLECRIDARRERPEDRIFAITDLRAHILRERRSLVQAGLTILKAYIAAGMPRQPVARFGRFEAWSDWVRSAVVWAGLADPCETRERILVSDPERQALHGVLASWHALFQGRPMLVREVMAKLDESPEKQAPAEQDAVASLREIFLEIAGARNNPKLIDVRRVAGWLRSYSGRVAAGLTLTRGSQTIHKVATWRVTVEAAIERTPVTAFASNIVDKPVTEMPAQDREEF